MKWLAYSEIKVMVLNMVTVYWPRNVSEEFFGKEQEVLRVIHGARHI
jgi:hypothetical protein